MNNPGAVFMFSYFNYIRISNLPKCGVLLIKESLNCNKQTQWGRRRRYIRPQVMPSTTPTMSAIQSFISALRLKLGWMSSITPPKALAPKNTGSNPKRPVLERGKESAAKVTRCTNLSLPFGAGGGWSKGHSIATESIAVTISVRGMSRYLRIRQG